MRAPRLVQVMKDKSIFMSEGLVGRIRASSKCNTLLFRVPESEQEEYAHAIYRDLIQWLEDETESRLEERYVALGRRRACQGVPINQLFWAVTVANEYLWDYMQQECLHEDPVEFWGGVMLLRSLARFFDRIVYFALIGYEQAGVNESAALAFLGRRQSA